MWPVVRERLPAPPARVVEVGCGPLGGFIPMLRGSGYDAIGVDPKAPAESSYRRTGIEDVDPVEPVDVVVASTSLHHVEDPQEVIAGLAALLAPGGAVVVIEWAWEDFDEPTARWCFGRLRPDEEGGWLRRRRDEWAASGLPWDSFLREWADEEHIHRAGNLVRLLDDHFDREHVARGPYFFSDLSETSEEDELAAIAAGEIQPTRLDYIGRAARSAAA